MKYLTLKWKHFLLKGDQDDGGELCSDNESDDSMVKWLILKKIVTQDEDQ